MLVGVQTIAITIDYLLYEHKFKRCSLRFFFVLLLGPLVAEANERQQQQQQRISTDWMVKQEKQPQQQDKEKIPKESIDRK